jgi:predicted phage terminase large subunit-like protein
MGRSGRTRRAYISDIAREQISPLKIEELIRRVAVKDGHEVPIILEVEGGSQAKGLVEHYRRNVLEGFKVIFAPAGNKSKMLKAQPFIAGVESGNVFLVSRRSNMEIVGLPVSGWHKTFYDEFDGFSLKTSKHDDQIDTASMCYNELFKDSIVDIAWGRDEEVYDSFSNLKKFGVRKVTATSEENLDSAYGSGNRKSGKIFKGLVW